MNQHLPDSAVVRVSTQIQDLVNHCREIGETSVNDTNKMGALLQEMIVKYYGDVRLQAQQSFRVALVVSTVGVMFFVYAIWCSMMKNPGPGVEIGTIAGTLIQVISGINFYLYSRVARQFGAFHVCLERTNRFLLANSLCEKLEPPARDAIRAELTMLVANAPMLTHAVIEGRASHRSGLLAGRPNSPLRPTTGAAGAEIDAHAGTVGS